MEHHPDLPEPQNPWGEDIWPGVSSSGSGVATAAGLCYASLGSDTGGSIRFPSACNGLTGVKPTWGLVSRHGIMDLAPSYDSIGPMTRSAADSAAVLQAIAGHDPEDATSLVAPVPDYVGGLSGIFCARGLRIGVDAGHNGEDGPTIEALEAALAVFGQIGTAVAPVRFPDPAALLGDVMDLIVAEIALTHAATFPSQASLYGAWIRAGIERGHTVDPMILARGTIERDKFKGRLAALFTEVDAVLTPVFLKGTPTWSELRDLMARDMNAVMKFTAPINAAGLPAVTFPCGQTPDGRRIGLQLVGPWNSEAILLRAVHAFQQATEWHLAHPALG